VKFDDHFQGLLTSTVNLNPDRLRQLDEHVGAIDATLRDDSELSRQIQKLIPQGSLAQRTIIKPVSGVEFDADLLVRLKQQCSWEDDPQQYVLAVYDALNRCPRYRERIELKTRCVRVNYANDCHVDLVSYVYRAGYFPQHRIVNRLNNQFELVNPAGFALWMQRRDRIARGNLRKSLRLLKYLRDSTRRFDVPSAILSVVVGQRVTRLWELWDDRYQELPVAFSTLLSSTNRWLQKNPTVPHIADPSCPDARFDHRLTAQSYDTMRVAFDYYAQTAMAALKCADHDESLRLWREVFGVAFAPTVR
jgi:hypothetical protein